MKNMYPDRPKVKPGFTADSLTARHGSAEMALTRARSTLATGKQLAPDDEDYLDHWKDVVGVLEARLGTRSL